MDKKSRALQGSERDLLMNVLLSLLILAGCNAAVAQDTAKKIVTVTIDASNKAQSIDNFGASGCWFSEGIGKYWPVEKKERIAELLFSRSMDANGNPKGIGLSAWRFNIGGGTAEQGDSSGIRDPNRRVECFLNPDGAYDWSKQSGYTWFLKKAKYYGVENLIAFSNTPPVQFTQNRLGFKTSKDFRSNLKLDKYDAYAGFLADVVKHFDSLGLHFNYISPVNEPQWDWSGEFGKAKQEGSPWTNEEIYKVLKAVDSSFTHKKLSSKILAPEAAMLTYLYTGNGLASSQVQQLYGKTSRLYANNLRHMPSIAAGHSYFTEVGDSAMISIRKSLADTLKKYGVDYWQSEYSMLDDGYKEGVRGRIGAMDCALFLAKVIHTDLTVANAKAWQFWNAYEPGNAMWDTRYYLIALKPNMNFTDGDFTVTKNLWALGHYSLFIRPGMYRINLQRSNDPGLIKAARDVMVSAYSNTKDKTVLVAINYSRHEQVLKISMKNFKKVKAVRQYVTTAASEDNMKAYPVKNEKEILLPARSVNTVVIEH